jgi:hypothetical protein
VAQELVLSELRQKWCKFTLFKVHKLHNYTQTKASNRHEGKRMLWNKGIGAERLWHIKQIK